MAADRPDLARGESAGRLSAGARNEFVRLTNDTLQRALADSGVARSFTKEIELSTPDFAGACADARNRLQQAIDKWKQTNPPPGARPPKDVIVAAAVASFMCGLAGQPTGGTATAP